jgi:hypothetical protein
VDKLIIQRWIEYVPSPLAVLWEGVEVLIVEGLSVGVLDGTVHPLGLIVGPALAGLVQAVARKLVYA